jgi:hypothetical protein
MKTFLSSLFFVAAILIITTTLQAQTNIFPLSGNVGIGTTSPVTLLQIKGGSSRFGSNTNNLNIDSLGNLTFNGNAAYKVAGNKYAFQYAGNPNYGLFFNASNVQYEFRNGSAAPVFIVNANTGNGVFNGSLKVGAYTLPATDGANGQVLTTNGSGNISWSTVSGGGSNANQSLSNLSTTAVNVALLAGTDNAFNLGSATNSWKDAYLDGSLYLGGSRFLAYAAGSGTGNTAVGAAALNSNTSGGDNTATGFNALFSNTTGGINTAIGNSALYSNSTGSFNTAMGYDALYSNSTGSFNTASGNVVLKNNTSGSYNVASGYSALYNNQSGNSNVALGRNALNNNIHGSNLVAIGDSALYSIQGTGWDNDYGENNTAVGSKALFGCSAGFRNTAIGYAALSQGSERGGSYENVAVGFKTLYNNIGYGNVAVGNNALFADSVGYYNTAIGYNALLRNYGDDYYLGDCSGCHNTSVGSWTLADNTSGAYNASLGSNAGSNVITGNHNTFIGSDANCGVLGSVNNSTVIGSGALITASDHFLFGNSAVVGWGFGVESGTRAIKVGTNSTNGNGAYLSAGGVWTDVSDKKKKENFTKPDKNDILKKINQLEISHWRYKGTDSEYHIGPMAQDFYKLFHVGNDTTTSAMDKAGIALLGVQQLAQQNNELKDENKALRSEIDELSVMVQQLQQRFNNCNPCSRQSALNDAQQTIVTGNAFLEQNIPNPFNHRTTIGYQLPQKFSSAQIVITDNNGKAIKSVNITGISKGIINIDASTLASGAYNYALYADGRFIASKQMILAR